MGVWHQTQMGCGMLPCGPCCCMQTLLVGASQPSHPVNDLQIFGGMPPDSYPFIQLLPKSWREDSIAKRLAQLVTCDVPMVKLLLSNWPHSRKWQLPNLPRL